MKTIAIIICLIHSILIIAYPSIAQNPKTNDTLVQLYLLQTATDSLPKSRISSPKRILYPDSIIGYAYKFLGDRYRRGGTTSKGFDCSGYTMMVFKHFGIKLPHTSSGQSLVGIEVSKRQIKKGDLIFFRGRNSRRRGIGHVGIVISERGEPVRFIHSSTSNGVRIDRLDADYFTRRYMKTSRVLPL